VEIPLFFDFFLGGRQNFKKKSENRKWVDWVKIKIPYVIVQRLTGSWGLLPRTSRRSNMANCNVVLGVTSWQGRIVHLCTNLFYTVAERENTVQITSIISLFRQLLQQTLIMEAPMQPQVIIQRITEGNPVADMNVPTNIIGERRNAYRSQKLPRVITPGEAKVGHHAVSYQKKERIVSYPKSGTLT